VLSGSSYAKFIYRKISVSYRRAFACSFVLVTEKTGDYIKKNIINSIFIVNIAQGNLKCHLLPDLWYGTGRGISKTLNNQ